MAGRFILGLLTGLLLGGAGVVAVAFSPASMRPGAAEAPAAAAPPVEPRLPGPTSDVEPPRPTREGQAD